MTDFMTALPVILVQPTCPGDQRMGDHTTLLDLKKDLKKDLSELCCAPDVTDGLACGKPSSSSRPVTCAERATKLSFLSTHMCAASVSGKDAEDLQTCVRELKGNIEKSDAMLYAPSSNDVAGNCKMMSLHCYILELKMVISEEEVDNKIAGCILDFHEEGPLKAVNSVGCPPCEAYSLKNITVFLDRLNNLLKEITAGLSNT